MAFSEDIVELAGRFGIEEMPEDGPVVERKDVLAFAEALKKELGFHVFLYCAATHYPPDEKNELPDRTLVAYRLRRLPTAAGRPTETFPFRLWVPTGETTPSLTSIWAGADWQEREQYDLVGTVFEGHPDPRRLMMPEDWPGHPLRREYAIETQHYPWR